MKLRLWILVLASILFAGCFAPEPPPYWAHWNRRFHYGHDFHYDRGEHRGWR
jgi:hypothetical protein